MKIITEALVCLMLAAVFTIIAEGSFAEENKHFKTTLESNVMRLDIDAAFACPEAGSPVAVYSTDYPNMDRNEWLNFFFPGNKDGIDVLEGETAEELADEMIFDKDRELLFDDGNTFTRYNAYYAALLVDYRGKDVVVSWGRTTNSQAGGLVTTREESTKLATEWMKSFTEQAKLNGFILDDCYTMPNEYDSAEDTPDNHEYYVIRFYREVDGLQVAVDKPPVFSLLNLNISGDVLDVFVDDDGVFMVDGYYRQYIRKCTESINISFDDAVQILHENMENVLTTKEDPTYQISQVGLCYRLVQTLDLSDMDSRVITEARPAWRFASRVNLYMANEFVIFIDAITGEVLP